VQLVEEFLARSVAFRPGRPQFDSRSDLRRLEIVGRKWLGAATP